MACLPFGVLFWTSVAVRDQSVAARIVLAPNIITGIDCTDQQLLGETLPKQDHVAVGVDVSKLTHIVVGIAQLSQASVSDSDISAGRRALGIMLWAEREEQLDPSRFVITKSSNTSTVKPSRS